MSDHDDVNETVEIDFEVGHISIIRSEATTIHNPPRTHDWKVFLRSADINGDLSCLIQRCIFHLHPEFPNNKRELKTTPFAIQETGYAGFHLPIDIYFKTRKEPKKFRIEYDLDLHKNIDGHPYRQKESYLRKYRCTFYNPDPEFRQKILAAGGKINDSGPIVSNNINIDGSDIDEEQVPTIRQSPQQKRHASPANGINNKKIKLEQPINNLKKKQVQSVNNKTIMNNKKTKLVSYKSSSILEEKVSKNLPIKELNQTITVNGNTENSLLSKPRTSTKFIKSQSTNDIKPSIQSTIITNTKKKEPVPSPSKSKSVTPSQTVITTPINKNPKKTLIKTESTTTVPIVKSPLNIISKQKSSSQPSSTITPSVSINDLKKIPKKPLPPKIEEKRSRSSMSSSSLDRNLIRDSQKQQLLSSKTQSNLKRDHSSSSVKNSNSNDRSRKTKIIKDHSINQSSNSSRYDQSNHQKPILSQSHIDLSINSTVDTSQPSIPTPPFTHILQNENNHSLMDINRQNNTDHLQLSDESSSSHEQILIQPTKISRSDQSDINDSEISIEDDNEEQDLPTSLTNDDLRYKLIYIYKRFQLNLINDLIIFVRFFKRHQLIDISSLSMTKATNEMFTYDLLSLSPSHIGELANDLGYTTMNMINSME